MRFAKPWHAAILPANERSEILEGMAFPFESAPEKPRFHKAGGCDGCGGSGYRGRTGIYELRVITEEIRRMILRRASAGEISRVAEREGDGAPEGRRAVEGGPGRNDGRRSIKYPLRPEFGSVVGIFAYATMLYFGGRFRG